MLQLSRRALLKSGAMAFGSVSLIPGYPAKMFAASLAKTTGIQLYTVAKELSEDMPGTLSKLTAIGYRSVESAGLAGRSAAEFRKQLDEAGLKCPSSHLFMKPGQSPQAYMEDIKVLGSEYAVTSVIMKPGLQIKSMADYMKYLSSLTQDDYKRMASDVNTLASQAKTVGLKFAYHNHNMEFRKWSDGTTGYDTLMAETDPALVKIELDCGWAELAGQSPVAMFKKYPGRVRMLHIKDFVAVGHPVVTLDEGHMPEGTELGKGHIDYRPILAAAPAAGVEYIFVEQEPPFVKFTALEAAKVDYDYLQSIG